MKDPLRAADVVIAIAPSLIAAEKREKNSEVLRWALNIASGVTHLTRQLDVLVSIVPAVEPLGQGDTTLRMVDSALPGIRMMNEPGPKVSALSSAAIVLSALGKKDRARVVLRQAQEIADSYPVFRGATLQRPICKAYARLGNLRGARRLVQELPLNYRALIAADLIREARARPLVRRGSNN